MCVTQGRVRGGEVESTRKGWSPRVESPRGVSVLGGLGPFVAGNHQLPPIGRTERAEGEESDPGSGEKPVQVLEKLERKRDLGNPTEKGTKARTRGTRPSG